MQAEPREARYAVSAVFFVFGTLVGGWISHIPEVQNSLHLSNRELGYALLGSGLGSVSVIPFSGAIIHRFGSRHTSVLSGLFACLLVPGLVFEKSVFGLVLNLISVGLCYGCLDVAMNAHAVAVQERFSKPIMSAVHGWFSFGGFAGGGGAALAALLGWKSSAHLIVNSASLAILLLVSERFLLPAHVDRDTEGPRFVIPRGILLTLGILCLCAFVVEVGVWDWSAVYLENSLHASKQLVGLGVGLFAFAMAFSRFAGDRAVARLGNVRVLGASGLLAAGGILVGVSVPIPGIAIAGFALCGLGVANIAPILFATSGSLKGVPTGTAVAAITTCGYAGLQVGPPIIGKIADLRSVPFAIGLLSLLALAIVVCGPRAVARIEAQVC